MLHIKLIKSIYGQKPRNRATVQALGLRRINQVVEQRDTPNIRGMVRHVAHMLSVVEVEDPMVGEVPAVASEAATTEEAVKPKRTTKKAKSADASEEDTK